MKSKVTLKKCIFYFITIITLAWMIFYTFVYDPHRNLYLFFTYQSNFMVWIYYAMWLMGFQIYRYFNSRKLLNLMNHKNWTIFIATIISTTTFIAIFVLGPYELTYSLIKDYDGTFNSLSASSATTELNLGRKIYMAINSTLMHTLIPWLVIYDLSKTYYANKKQSNFGINTFAIFYFIAYIIFVNINGLITDIYPYTPLDPNAFDNETIGLLHQVVSPIIGFIIFIFILKWWNRRINENNIYQKII